MTDKSAAEILREARALIDAPWKWTKKVYGVDYQGRYVTSGDFSLARSLCSYAAVVRASGGVIKDEGDADGISESAVDALSKAIGSGIADWNDAPSRTHAEVLAAFDRAIAIAEGER